MTTLGGAAGVTLLSHKMAAAQAGGTLQQSLVTHGRHRTYVNAAGPKTGEAVLMLHGSGPGSSAWSNWQFAVPFLQDRFFAVAPDLAGFGRSPAPTPYPNAVMGWMKHWIDQLVSLIDHYALPKVHLVGNSMGGAVALHLLMNRPERIGKVVLMGAVGVPVELTPELDAIWGFYDDPSAERMQQITDWFAYSTDVTARFKAIGQARFEAAMVPEVRNAFAAMFPAPRQRHLDAIVVPGAAIRLMTHPALIIHGRDDRIIPVRSSHYLADTWGGPVQLHVYGRCGHWTQVEHERSFNELVRDFFEGRA